MCKYVFLINFFIFFSGFLVSNAYAKECFVFEDLLGGDGCTVNADRAFHNWGYVRLKAKAVGSGKASLDTIFHVVGPYNPPLLQADFSSRVFEKLLPIQNKINATIVYYEFSEINDYALQDKAYALVSAMKKIDQFRGYTRPSFMMGLSLGGVIARYGLISMEQEGYEHGVTHYFSIDSPHQGAHVPLAMQEMFGFFPRAFQEAKDDNSDSFGDILRSLGLFFDNGPVGDFKDGMRELSAAKKVASEAASLLSADSMAAKQLLIHHASANNGRMSEGHSLLNELGLMGMPLGGDLPVFNIGVANGSITGNKFTPSNDYYFNWVGNTIDDIRFLLTLPVMGRIVESDFRGVRPRIQFYKTIIFTGKFTYPDASSIIGDNGKDTYVEHKFVEHTNNQISSPVPYDLMACSTVELPSLIADMVTNNFSVDQGTNDIGKYFNGFDALQKSNCFVPSASALAVSGTDFISNDTNLVSRSPFHAVYGQSGNLSHDLTTFDDCSLTKNGTPGSTCFWNDLLGYVEESHSRNIFWAYDNPNNRKISANVERLVPIFHLLM